MFEASFGAFLVILAVCVGVGLPLLAVHFQQREVHVVCFGFLDAHQPRTLQRGKCPLVRVIREFALRQFTRTQHHRRLSKDALNDADE